MKKIFLAYILIFILNTVFLKAELKLFGYFENRAFVIENPDYNWKDPGEKLRLGDYNRVRLKYEASPSSKVTVNVAVDFYSYHGMINTPLWVYIGPKTPTSQNVRIDLDRAYVDLHFKKFDLTVGKQRAALGVSYLWAPLDIFNRVNIFDPKEEKAGINAFKVYIPLGKFSSITGIFSPDLKVKSSTSALRVQTQVYGVDSAVTLMRLGANRTSVYSLDLRGENFIGWWVEAGYFVSPDPDNDGVDRKHLKLVLGFDYTFALKNGLYWLSEFFYDASGEKNPSAYDFKPVILGERYTLGRNLFFSMLRYPLNDFWIASFSYIADLGDKSFVLNPMIQYDLTQNIQVSAGLYLFLGKEGGEFKKYNEHTFFIWLNVHF